MNVNVLLTIFCIYLVVSGIICLPLQANLKIKDEKDTLRVSWEHLSQPDGRVCDEGSGQEGWAGE
jgi:hypothetical protein